MFCSECGKEGTGKFCWNCGSPLRAGGGAPQPPPSPLPGPPPVPVHWHVETNYEALLRHSEVRDILARQTPPTAWMTGEQFADSLGKIIQSPIPLGPVMGLMQSFYGQLGVKTGKTRSEQFGWPVGKVIVSTLCALARGGHKVKDVRQALDGCMLICEIPSDLFSLAGQLIVTIRREPAGASVHADTHIAGQLYDWGKSSRALNELFVGVGQGC